MRKKDKKQLLDLIKTMETANQMLAPMLEKGQLSEMDRAIGREWDKGGSAFGSVLRGVMGDYADREFGGKENRDCTAVGDAKGRGGGSG